MSRRSTAGGQTAQPGLVEVRIEAHATAAQGTDSYRRAVPLALKDRRLTHEEEVELAIVAHDLGLSAPEAMRARIEVERDLRAEGGEGAWRA